MPAATSTVSAGRLSSPRPLMGGSVFPVSNAARPSIAAAPPAPSSLILILKRSFSLSAPILLSRSLVTGARNSTLSKRGDLSRGPEFDAESAKPLISFCPANLYCQTQTEGKKPPLRQI
jgi:hypothetical protein